MPEAPEVEIDEEPSTPIANRSASFNSMKDKLESLMAPFQEPVKEKPVEAAPTEPVKPADVKPPVTQISVPKPKEPEPAPVPTPEVKPAAVEEELPESIRKSPKASEEFKKINARAQQFKADAEKNALAVKSLEEQLTKFKNTPITPIIPAEYESIKKEREELSNQLKMVAIERHPQFRATFEGRTTAAIEKAKSVLGAEITDKATKLAQLPPSDYRAEQLDKMLLEAQETSPTKAAFLSDLIKDIHGISFDKAAAIARAQDDYDAVQKHDQEKAKSAQAEALKNREAFTAQALDVAKTLEAFRRSDDPAINSAVDERERNIKAIINGEVDPQLLPYIPVLAMEATYLRETVLPGLREENAKLLKQISEMTQSTPRPGQGGGETTPIQPKSAGKSFIERYRENAPKR